MSRKDKLEDFINRINKGKDPNSTTAGARMSGTRTKVPRLKTGILSLDIALGGGLPRGKVSLVFGPESSGKTTIALQCCAGMSHVCHNCKEDIMSCDCGNFEEGVVMLVDAEGTYDDEWAEANGLNPNNLMLVIPDTGEEACEIIETAILEGLADLIILDSIEHCQSTKEIDSSMTDAKVSPNAKMFNEFWRKATRALRITPNPPHLYAINQVRQKLMTRGDDLQFPHGNGQKFAASLYLRLRKANVSPIAGGPNEAYVTIHGSIPKNKTATPKKEFTFNLNLVDYDCNKKGRVNNIEKIVSIGRSTGFISVASSGKNKGWRFELDDGDGNPLMYKATKRETLIDLIRDDEDLYTVLYDYMLELALEGNL